MAPPRKKVRYLDPDFVREMVLEQSGAVRADSDSDSPSESDSDDTDSESDYGPTHDNQSSEAGDESDVSVMHDSDSEFEDEANVEAPPENHQQDQPWISLGEEEWNPDWLDEYDDQPKLLFDADNGTKPVDFFYRYFPEDLFDTFATQTNLYARQYRQRIGVLQQHSRFNKWRETNSDELKAFTALQIAMGLVSKPALPMYWEGNWLLGTPGFGSVMSRNR